MDQALIKNSSSYFNTMLRRYASETPCVQAIFAVNDTILLEHGEEIHPRSILLQMVEDLKKFDLFASLLAGQIRFSKVTTIEKGNQKYDLYTYSIEKNKNFFRSIVLLPFKKIPIEDEFQLFNNLVLNYYINLPKPIDYQIIDTYSMFLEKISKEIGNYFTDKKEVGVLSHFFIQDLRNYYKNMSQQFTEEIHKQIEQSIMRYLKKGDLLFMVNQRSYITYSHNCNVDTVQKRYNDIFFQLNTLIIRYNLTFEVIDESNYKSREFWDTILCKN